MTTKVLFLTSIRDVGGDDRVGQVVPTSGGFQYMEGAVERVVRSSLWTHRLHGFVEVVGVVYDDRDDELKRIGYSPLAEGEDRWIFPTDMPRTDRGDLMMERVRNIPSGFRSIPKSDPTRNEAKRAFEQHVLDVMREWGADLLISDHYMAKIEFLHKEFGLYGRVLNIHPAVTKKDCQFCFRGKAPTAEALALARTGVPTKTGATLHIVNDEFDDGPIIEWDAPTPVKAMDTPWELRWRNYRLAKLPVLEKGLRSYVEKLSKT